MMAVVMKERKFNAYGLLQIIGAVLLPIISALILKVVLWYFNIQSILSTGPDLLTYWFVGSMVIMFGLLIWIAIIGLILFLFPEREVSE